MQRLINEHIFKYPRTPHLEGSCVQMCDEDLDTVPFSAIQGRHVVVSEKIDGANCGISFSKGGDIRLQSRGHYLLGGPREKQFDLFKAWSARLAGSLWDVLKHRYLLYGEWCYAKHTLYYDQLPAWFLAIAVLDMEAGVFLGASERDVLLVDLPVVSVPVLLRGRANSIENLMDLLGPSRFIGSRSREHFAEDCARVGADLEEAERQSDLSGMMEGLYITVEEEGRVDRKFVGGDFRARVVEQGSDGRRQPIIPNRVRDG